MAEDPLSKLWPFLAALAGSYVALSLERFRNLTPRQKLTVVASSFLGTIFVGPAVIGYCWPNEPIDSRFIGGFYFALGCTFMTALPLAVTRLAQLPGFIIDFIVARRGDGK